MPLTVEIARSIWAVVEKVRRPEESWIEACERELYRALQAEGLTQEKMAAAMSENLSYVNRRLQKAGSRPKDKKHLRAV